MLKIEIGQWEGGQKIGLTFECDKQTNAALYNIDKQ